MDLVGADLRTPFPVRRLVVRAGYLQLFAILLTGAADSVTVRIPKRCKHAMNYNSMASLCANSRMAGVFKYEHLQKNDVILNTLSTVLVRVP